MNGKGTIMTFTSMKAKSDPNGTKKKSGFRFFNPAMTDPTVIKPKTITQIISTPL